MSELSVLSLRPEEGCSYGERPQSHVVIDMLPDNVLLEIFHRYREDPSSKFVVGLSSSWRWNTLTQVCRRWRHVIFESPRYLDLRIVCTNTTPTRTSLDIWPPFPISIFCLPWNTPDEEGVANIVAAVERRDRTSQICINDIKGSALENLIAAMHEPLPTLRHFSLRSTDKSVPALPKTFLGGSAPLLELFILSGVPFPTFPKFALSATHVVYLHLFDIPNSGYISPEEMAACLSALPNLESLSITFRSPPSRLLQVSRLPLTRLLLPALTRLFFGGVSEYFEDLVARMYTPLLNRLIVAFFMDLVFDIPRLNKFMGRTEGFRDKPFNQACMEFSGPVIKMNLVSQSRFELEIRCERLDWQLSSMTQIFSQQLPHLSHVELLEIHDCFGPKQSRWTDDLDMDPSQWVELFRPFIAVQRLYISESLVPPIAAALRELTGGRVMEVLPALINLSLGGLQPPGLVQEGIQTFIASRQLSARPVVIQPWEHRVTELPPRME